MAPDRNPLITRLGSNYTILETTQVVEKNGGRVRRCITPNDWHRDSPCTADRFAKRIKTDECSESARRVRIDLSRFESIERGSQLLASDTKTPLHGAFFVSGGQGRNRTTDTRIFSPLLYQLSYLAVQGHPQGRAPTKSGVLDRYAARQSSRANRCIYPDIRVIHASRFKRCICVRIQRWRSRT